MVKNSFLCSALMCAALTACTVKEDRMECPTYVTVQADTDTDCLVSFYSLDGTLVERNRLTAAQVTGGDNCSAVPRGDLYVSVVQDYPTMVASGGRTVRCMSDSTAATVRAVSGRVHVTGDDYLYLDRLAKQYARVHLSFVDTEKTGGYSYDVRVVSSHDGLDLITLEPSDGDFSYSLDLKGTLSAEFNLLRQRDGEAILLEFRDPATGELLNEVRLSDFIARTGYSWSVTELPDIHVLIDYVRAAVTIRVNGWETPQTFSFTI